MIGIRILSSAMAKAMSKSMETTVGASSDPMREKEVTDYLRDFLPTDTCTNIGCRLPGMALLVSMARFGK